MTEGGTSTDTHFGHHIGVPTMDNARYSAPPIPIERCERLKGGLTTFALPAQPHVQSVDAPGQGGVVALWLAAPMRVEVPIAPDVRERSFGTDVVFVLPEGMATRWQAEAGQPACTHLHIGRDFGSAWLEEPAAPSWRPSAKPADHELLGLFRRITLGLGHDGPFRRLALQGLALSAASRLLEVAAGVRATPVVSRAMTPVRMRRVGEFVETNLSSDLCLQDLAAVVGLSPSHFSRAFKAETGMSPYAWVVGMRIERVKAELLGTRKSLPEIALDCGFSSQSHMTSLFRKVVGVPPARWAREQGAGARALP